MTVRFKSMFEEERVCPWLGDLIVEPGGMITVPDEQWESWKAGGWEPLDPDPAKPPTPAVPQSNAPAPAVAPTPPAPPATPATTTTTKGADQ
jgi:hypothetical protein